MVIGLFRKPRGVLIKPVAAPVLGAEQHTELQAPQLNSQLPLPLNVPYNTSRKPTSILMPGYPVSDDFVTDVTDYLSPEAIDFIERSYPGTTYKAFMGVSPMGFTLNQTPVVIATRPNGLQSQIALLSEKGIIYEGCGAHGENGRGDADEKRYWGEHARTVLVKGSVTPDERQRIIDLYENELKSHGEWSILATYERRPRESQIHYFPYKQYQLVRTIADKLPVQFPLSQEFEWKLR